MDTCELNITPEDFFRKVVRTDGNGNYALAVNELPAGAFTQQVQCQDGITFEDILRLVYNETEEAINIIDVT